MPQTTRPSRDYDFVPGIGSHVEIAQYHHTTRVLQAASFFDIKIGTIREFFINKNTTHSGSNGATLRTRTGFDWSFALALDFPAAVEEGLKDRFPQSILGSSHSVAIKFFIGDPLYWSSHAWPARSYRATKALLSSVETVLDNSGTEVVGLNIAGEGNSLLYTYLGIGANAVPVHPGIWY